MATPYFGLIDDSDASPRFALTGTAFTASTTTNFKGTQKAATAGFGTSNGTYTFTGLPNSTFDVWSTWNPWNTSTSSIDASADVPHQIYDNTTLLQTVSLNQVQYPLADGHNTFRSPSPPWDVQGNGSQWRKIGTYAIASGTLKVVITNGGTTGRCWADAVRVTEATASSVCPGTPIDFNDTFTGTALVDAWTPVAGTWSVASNILSQTSATAATNRIRLWPYDWDQTKNFTILAKVRVDAWSNPDTNSQAGVSLHMDSAGAGAVSLCFFGNGFGSSLGGQVEILVDGGASTAANFTWALNTWYWFRFNRNGNTLNGKVWADGSAEPGPWTLSVATSTLSFFGTTGYPGLNSGKGSSKVSFQSVSAGPLTSDFGCSISLQPNHATVSSGGVFTLPARTGSMSKSITHPTISSGGVRTLPTRTGSCTRSINHPTISSAGVRVVPQYQAATTLSRHPTFTAMGGQLVPNYAAVATLDTQRPTMVATTSYIGPAFQSAPLFISGSEGIAWGGSAPMVIGGAVSVSETMPLAVVGWGFVTEWLPLYLYSPIGTTHGLNLSIAADPVPRAAGSMHLLVRGSTVGQEGMAGLLTLAVEGWDEPPYKALNLAIRGVDRGALSGVLNLNIRGANPSIVATAPLYVENGTALFTSDLHLYVGGEGVTPGAVPLGSQLGLYVQRGPNAGMYLYVENKWSGSSLPLVIAGHPDLDGQAPLFIEGMGGTITGNVPLSIPVVSSPVTRTGQLTLAIPKVVGPLSGTVPVSIVGWNP